MQHKTTKNNIETAYPVYPGGVMTTLRCAAASARGVLLAPDVADFTAFHPCHLA
ncbi:hypothetical protein ACFSHT_36175 [Paraburkholderia silviterrae]|uniref:hypothetical protein n=1 Tax=Paraburkholderia silviterrae TaxID=2528715 RepID=UPI001404F51E|nr:hypothetical protein [Paraburkholderia silviterrae]